MQIRLRELAFTRGLSEDQLCKKLGIDYKLWKSLTRGLRSPSHSLIIELMAILGDEVQMLFLGAYMEESYPKLIPANEYLNDKNIEMIKEKIEKINKRNGRFRYL
ncbi:MAG: hypothetical protein WC867_01810 [Candidatus Pacearchaeota archaeon]